MIGLAQRILVIGKAALSRVNPEHEFNQELILAYASGIRAPDYSSEYIEGR